MINLFSLFLSAGGKRQFELIMSIVWNLEHLAELKVKKIICESQRERERERERETRERERERDTGLEGKSTKLIRSYKWCLARLADNFFEELSIILFASLFCSIATKKIKGKNI